MGSPLFENNVLIYKNDVLVHTTHSRLLYDETSGMFKVLIGANIWTTFKPAQIIGIGPNTNGSVLKKHNLAMRVRFPSGDEWSFVYQTKTREDAEQKMSSITYLIWSDRASEEAGQLLKTRERVSVNEICEVFKKYQVSSDFASGRKFIESSISSGFAPGKFDGQGFVSRSALDREQVRYDIVTKFEVGQSGAVVFKCPSCGAPLQIQSKDANGKCKYCNASFAVPRKILDMI